MNTKHHRHETDHHTAQGAVAALFVLTGILVILVASVLAQPLT